jgi:hypothetical protein
MPTIIKEIPGASDANSYETLAEFNAYLAIRLHVPATVTVADDPTKETALVMGTRVLNDLTIRRRRLVIAQYRSGVEKFYLTPPYWTGQPATDTQNLPWPRIGMRNRNGVAIPINVIPQELKDALSELSMQLMSTDRTLDNEIIDQGITDITAGPVSLSFKDIIPIKVIPDAVYNLLVPSWLTEETYEPIPMARFGTIGLSET